MSEEASTTLECEHDIATVALLPCGILVSFTQVEHLPLPFICQGFLQWTKKVELGFFGKL